MSDPRARHAAAVRAFLRGRLTYAELRRIENDCAADRISRFHGMTPPHPAMRVGPPVAHVPTADEAILLKRVVHLEWLARCWRSWALLGWAILALVVLGLVTR